MASYWEAVPGSDAVKCLLCPNSCVILPAHAGRCRVRANENGTLIALAFGSISSLALDPVEKKPLAKFCPGKKILSAGSYGCNLSCTFCQNHAISQHEVPIGTSGDTIDVPCSSEELVKSALVLVPKGNVGIAYTYNEPFINFEFVLETCKAARVSGLKNVLVTNGFVNPEPLAEIMPFVDAVNVDLKSFKDEFYQTICGGHVEPVKKTIAAIAREFPLCDLEVTTLVIPGLNSASGEIDEIARFLASCSENITLHLSRHHPDYKMLSPEPIAVDELMSLADIARKRLPSVQCGNIW